MSIRLMNAVWDMDLPDSEKLVMLSLADNANDHGVCWPSIATIARRCSKSERTVQRTLRALEASGHITSNDIPGRGREYTVSPRQDDGATPCRGGGDTVSQKGCHGGTQTIIEPPVNRHTKRANGFDAPAPDGVSEETWAEFMQLRKRKRAPVTPKAYQMILDELANSLGTPEATVAKSVVSNWTGVFAIKNNGGSNGRSGNDRQRVGNNGLYHAAYEAVSQRYKRGGADG